MIQEFVEAGFGTPSPMLTVVGSTLKELERHVTKGPKAALQITAYNTEDGSDLRQASGPLTRSITEQVFTHLIHWTAATDFPATATRAVDLGAGGFNGNGLLTSRNLDGRGSVLLAGNHMELAGAGHYSPAALRAKDTEIQSKTSTSVGITLDTLYINLRQVGFQSPLRQEMRKEGLRLKVSASLPVSRPSRKLWGSLKIMRALVPIPSRSSPVEGVRQVVDIAAAKVGGHYSHKDLRQPIVQICARIHAHENIVLVGRPGFGAGEQLWPHYSGEWSAAHGLQSIPSTASSPARGL
ncbi:unnamed protein product [Peniophora sp. CBMAI 1063]|nr:unnamed protein product [Peniophora sp. CBMAI 1063]